MATRWFPANKRIQIFHAALLKVEHYGLLDASLINEIIYNKELPKGFAHLFAKANHLVMSRGQLARTENMNLNFIFKNPGDNDIYKSIYLSLSYLLWYALLTHIALFSRMRAVEDSFTRWMTITTMATFDSLFVGGSSRLAAVLSKALGKFMNCPHCKKRVSIGRKATGRFFLAQRIRCKNCKNEYDFPLFWLLSQVDQPVVYADRMDADLRGRDTIGVDSDQERQTHSDGQSVGHVHPDDQWAGLPFRKRCRHADFGAAFSFRRTVW
jgi:transcription elongation factor Elf1